MLPFDYYTILYLYFLCLLIIIFALHLQHSTEWIYHTTYYYIHNLSFDLSNGYLPSKFSAFTTAFDSRMTRIDLPSKWRSIMGRRHSEVCIAPATLRERSIQVIPLMQAVLTAENFEGKHPVVRSITSTHYRCIFMITYFIINHV